MTSKLYIEIIVNERIQLLEIARRCKDKDEIIKAIEELLASAKDR